MLKNIKDIKNVFYINLETREDRKRYFENQMKMVGLNAVRFNAIKHNIGAVGCSLSHLELLKYAKINDLDHILIMEDDIMFLNPKLFIENLNIFLTSQLDFDVLLIAGNNMGDYVKINNNCVKITHCQTTTGYLVKNHYYDKLIDNIQTGINHLMSNINLKIHYAIDQYWCKLQLIDKWYLLTPLTVSQRPDYSDIEKKKINYNNLMLKLDKIQRPPTLVQDKNMSNKMNSIIYNL